MAVEFAAEIKAYGFFYQKTSTGAQTLGRYATAENMKGTWTKDSSYAKGFLGSLMPSEYPNMRLDIKSMKLKSDATRGSRGD